MACTEIRLSSWWMFQDENKYTLAVVHLLGFSLGGQIDAVLFPRETPPEPTILERLRRCSRDDFYELVRAGRLVEVPQRSREP